MKPVSPDTRPEIERMWIEGIRKMTPSERLRRMEGLNEMMVRLAYADIRKRYPDAGEYEIRLRIASRRIPRELMIKAFGWDPDKEGY